MKSTTLSLLVTATRRRNLILRTALLLKLVLIFNVVCFAQSDKPALTQDERAELLKLIRDLQQRIEKLEAAQPVAITAATTAAPSDTPVASPVALVPPEPET